jgi:hypothetical protein
MGDFNTILYSSATVISLSKTLKTMISFSYCDEFIKNAKDHD